MDTVGVLLEEFYLDLNGKDPYALVDRLRSLEDVMLSCDEECVDVIREIVSDCQKKAAQTLRGRYSDTVRNIITGCRKQLRSRAALDSESSAQHGQRHLNAVLDLLGRWSNIVAELVDMQPSESVLLMSVKPLHGRVAEAAFGCYEELSEDRSLPSLCTKTLGREKTGENAVHMSLSSLDYLVSQVSAMRTVVSQYQSFLRLHGLETLAGDSELSRWREVEDVYGVLEGAYLHRAVEEALREGARSLLEVQIGVFIIQAVEDVFFIMSRVLGRALDLNIDSVIAVVGNRIVELLDPPDPCGTEDGELRLYSLLCSREGCRGVCVTTPVIDGEDCTTPRKPQRVMGADDNEGEEDENAVEKLASDIGADLAVGTMALAGAAGEWLAAFTSPSHSAPSSSSGVVSTPTYSTPPVSGSSNRGTPAARTPDLQTALVAALEADCDESNRDDMLQINEQAVYLNSLETARSSVQRLGDTVSGTADDESIHLRSIPILTQELVRSTNVYKQLLYNELDSVIRYHVYEQLFEAVSEFLHPSETVTRKEVVPGYSGPFVISGEEGDRRGSEPHTPLSRTVLWVLGTGDDEFEFCTSMRRLLSTACYHEFLSAIGREISDLLMNGIIGCEGEQGTNFNEWGALLLYDQVTKAIQIFEEGTMAATDESVKSCFTPLLWALKVLTLDKPADIKRYAVPSACKDIVDATFIRKLLAKRVDFSREAISRIKLDG